MARKGEDSFALGAAFVVLAALLASCTSSAGHPRPTRLRVSGSDTMLPLTTHLAKLFNADNPDVIVEVQGGGSTAGIAALIAGGADVCASSRPLAPDEAGKLFRRYRRLGVRTQVARDALAVFVHPENPVRSLTMLQLKGIFTGRIRQWEKVGGTEGTIRVLIRPPSSGTHGFFRAVVLQGEEYAPFAETIATTPELVSIVSGDPTAIAYGGMAFENMGAAAIAVGGALPTSEAVRAGTYPLARYLYLITPGPPDGAAKRFVEFCLSSAGQRGVAEAGYVPLVPVVHQ